MKLLVTETKQAWQALGQVTYGVTESEKKSLVFRRSIYVSNDIKSGEMLTPKNLRTIRPGLGLPPKYYEILLGKKVACDIKKGTPFTWDLLG